MSKLIPICAICVGAVAIASAANAAPRDIQFRSVNFATGVVQLHNFGASTESLAGWRFCTHDENQTFRYSGNTGLNGVSIPASESFFVHFNNDAAGANAINISTLGGSFALPLDGAAIGDAYGLGLYINGVFGNGNNLADHLQWSRDGLDNPVADERSDEAQNGLVWNDQTQWVATSASTTYIRLRNPTTGGAAGSSNINTPADYDALDAVPDCQPNGEDDFFDIADGTSLDTEPDGIPDECQAVASCDGDANGDLVIDVNDISFVLFRLGQNNGVCGDGDANGDGVNDVNDISYVLFRLGTCGAGGPCP